MTTIKLSLYFPGTQMTWESMAVLCGLGANKRHNLNENQEHSYYFFDGCAAPTSKEHLPVENMVFDKATALPKSSERTSTNNIGFYYRFAHGSGMNIF